MPKDNIDSLDDALEAVVSMNKTFSAFKEKNDERIAELEKKQAADPLLTEQLERMNNDMNEQQKTLDLISARIKRGQLAPTEEKSSGDADYRWWAAKQISSGLRATHELYTDAQQEAVANYKSAFGQLLRHRGDDKTLTADQLKALSVGSDPDGGYLVDPDTTGRMVRRIFDTSPMRSYASVQSIGSDALDGMYDTDELDYGWVAESGSRPETGTPQVQPWRISLHEMYAQPKATQKLLDDASISVESWLTDKISDRFSRAENAAYVNGDGVSQPRGFLTYGNWTTAGSYELGKLERFGTGVNGDFAATPDGGDILIKALEEGLQQQYRANATWFMNRKTVSKVRTLKNDDGTYLWAPGLAASQPSTLLGYNLAMFEDMPDYTGTGALAIAVGDMAAAYQIVDRPGIRVLRDPYSAKPFVLFYATKRVGGDVIDFAALKLIEFSA